MRSCCSFRAATASLQASLVSSQSSVQLQAAQNRLFFLHVVPRKMDVFDLDAVDCLDVLLRQESAIKALVYIYQRLTVDELLQKIHVPLVCQ